jgi:hypothetical protein
MARFTCDTTLKTWQTERYNGQKSEGTATGADLIKAFRICACIPIIRRHHERWDGKGPDQLPRGYPPGCAYYRSRPIRRHDDHQPYRYLFAEDKPTPRSCAA